MSKILAHIKTLGLQLPEPAAPVASYVPYVIAGNTVYISGQLPRIDGKLTATGHVGKNVNLQTAQKAAEDCALNLVAQLNVACGGDLDRVEQCVKLCGFVASTPDFTDQSKVINGASEMMEKIFGARGKHARSAVGVSALPLNAAVEVEAIFTLKK